MVRQRIKRYELGEVAHIENALRGESYGRTFRRKEDSEITEFEEIEKIETTERDLQSTSKFELKSEAERTIQENIKFEAGVTVTANGPSIEVSANAGFSYDRSSEESIKTGTTFARDVVDRSASRIQERVLTRRSSKLTRSVEETSNHLIDNSAATDHMVGIYRWVDKIYEAQVVNYGKRLILEFVIPEPAAFYSMSQMKKRLPGIPSGPPEVPSFQQIPGEKRPLRIGDITEDNYLTWVSQYNVIGVNLPPSSQVFVGVALEQPSKEGTKDSASKILEVGQLKIEPGYTAKDIMFEWAGTSEVNDDTEEYQVIVGPQRFTHRGRGRGGGDVVITRPADGGPIPTVPTSLPQIETRSLGNDHRYDANIPVSMVVKKYGSFTANVVIRCERTERALEDWKVKTFNSIMNRYAQLKADYDDQVAAAQVQGGVSISGNNPLANREIERNELKRQAIAIISGQNFDLFDAMGESGDQLKYPQVSNFSEAEREGEYIQFLEQAFEWHYMTYVFYPYFWGRKPGWIDVLNRQDTDPIFAQFLRSGAARVQVPIRGGFEEAVKFFLDTGRPWLGGESPQLEDDPGDGIPPFIPIVQEIREQTGAEFQDGEGTLEVVRDDVTIKGTDTLFTAPFDVNREIRVGGKVYVIQQVISNTEIVLTEPYAGESAASLGYGIGPKLVGQPWDVRLPTTLVMLQPDAILPSYSYNTSD